MARRCSRLFVSAARASVLCLPAGKCSPLSVSASCYLSLSSWAASGSGTSPWGAAGDSGCFFCILSRPEAQRSEVLAWPDGMWLWGESPDKHASDSTGLEGDGKGSLWCFSRLI